MMTEFKFLGELSVY